MDDSLHAARLGDLILHPPLMAELVSTLTEAVVYAAATAAVAAAIGGAVVAVVGTGGAATVLTPLIAGALVGAAAMLPGGEDKSIGEQISGFSDWVGNSMFPPEPYGAIETGSGNTHINGKPAARAAGIVTGASEAPVAEEEPSILQNIGSYAMLGASMMLPIIGLAQEINSIFNPPITTPADPGTQEAEQDTVKCSKHPTPNFVAQGSDKVFINGHPAARVGDKSTCDGPIGMTFSPNVRIGGGTVTVRDIRDGKSAAAKIIGLVAGMLISRGRKVRPRPGKAPHPQSRLPGCKGHPVVVSTGGKLLDGPQEMDFSLPGLIPLEWARRYDSTDPHQDGMFGPGWRISYESLIERVPHPDGGDLWVYVDDEGVRLELGRMQVGTAFVSSLDGLAFFHQDHGITVVENIYSGQYQVFSPDPLLAHRSRLVQVGDRNLNRLDVLYDNHGRLQYLVQKEARIAVEVSYDTLHTRRASQVHRLYLQPGPAFGVTHHEQLVSYSYTASGQLNEVRNANGQVVRRFTYTDNGLMASHTAAGGARFHYEWGCFAAHRRPVPGLPPLLEPRPEKEWRVIRHWSDDGEAYQFTYDLENGHTQVVDSLGREEHFYWGPLYELLRYIDPMGQCWEEEVVNGQLMASIDPQGARWSYTYDSLGRMVGQQDPLGRQQQLTYTEHWALATRVIDYAGRTWRYRYDTQGNLLSETDPLGLTTGYTCDEKGRRTSVLDPHGKQRQLQWNAQGQLTRHIDCSAQQTDYRYDERGNLSEIQDAQGNRTHYRFDILGNLLERRLPDGRTDHYEVGITGEVIGHRDPAQQVTRWQYDARGRLSLRTDAKGATLQLSWDAYDRLQRLTNENGEVYRFEWDPLDRLHAQHNLDGSAQRYHYDHAGKVVQADLYPSTQLDLHLHAAATAPSAKAQSQYFEHDVVGRMRCKRTDDGTTRYHYDAADNLLSIDFTPLSGPAQQLAFSYDRLGRMTRESSDDSTLEYTYDLLGNLQTLTLPDQRRINHLYYGSGHLHQLNLDGKVICDIERDELHAEVLRTQGQLRTSRRYDSTRRLVQQALHHNESAAPVLPLLQKDYFYDANDTLLREVVTVARSNTLQMPGAGAKAPKLDPVEGGQRTYHYDHGPTERLHGVSGDRQVVEHFGYDPAGNLLNGYQINGLVRHNRVEVYQDKRYRYDGFGRLSEKRSGTRLVQQFSYDAEHRLVCVDQQRGTLRERVEFSYDPLGRRTSKRLYREGHAQPLSETRFVWQGLRLLQEVQDNKPSLYVYRDQDSYEPVARVDGVCGEEMIYHFHTNLAGAPELLTDEQGERAWHCNLQAWGAARDEWHSDEQNRQQNLRYQGQYLDRETGLHYNTFRFYDPDIGRYTQPDPIGLMGGTNVYRYAPTPLTWIDPLGLSLCDIFGNNPYQTRYDSRHPGQPDPRYSVDTSTFTTGKTTANGGIRNRTEFWQQWQKQYPESLSKSNKFVIEKLGLSPKIDKTWIEHFPEHANYKGDKLIHHHVDFGKHAIPVPAKTHVGSGGIWHTK